MRPRQEARGDRELIISPSEEHARGRAEDRERGVARPVRGLSPERANALPVFCRRDSSAGRLSPVEFVARGRPPMARATMRRAADNRRECETSPRRKHPV
nr:hypothetical protein GCM10020241_59400 [Streptoalloteichus tenebrarius]